MYSHSPERNRVDVVDVDPYGTAAPFIDAAVQCVIDGGNLPPHINLQLNLTIFGQMQAFYVLHARTSPSWPPIIIRKNGKSRCMEYDVVHVFSNIATPIMAVFQSRPNTLMKR
jgi:hypothetical protein